MRFTLLWLVALTFAATAWIFASPVGASPDEPSHMAYAWGVATGQGFGGSNPSCGGTDCILTLYDVPPNLIPEPACYVFKTTVSAGCAAQSTVNPYPSYMTRYPPPYYAVVGSALRLGDAVGMTGQSLGYAGRFASALVALSMLVPAFAITHRSGSRTLPYAIAALVPMALFMIGSINPSGVEIASAIAAATAASVLIRTGGPAARITFAYSIAWLAWSRPVGWLWAVFLFAAVMTLLIIKDRRNAGNHWWRTLSWVELITASAILGSFLWFVYAFGSRSGGRSEGLSVPDGTVERLIAALLRWGSFLVENLGNLGWLDTQTPTILVFASLALLSVMIYIAARHLRRGDVLTRTLVVYVVATVAVTTALMIYQRFLWQGRYVLPPLVAGLILLATIGDRTNESWPDKALRRIASASWVVAMASAPWVYGRYAFGLEQGVLYSIPNISVDASWTPPLGAIGFIVVVVAAMSAVPWVLTMPARPHGTATLRSSGASISTVAVDPSTGSAPSGEPSTDELDA